MPFIDVYPLNNSRVQNMPFEYTSQVLYIQMYVVFAVGIPLNMVVMYISFIDKSIKNNYKYLLGNLALCDSLFLSSLLFSNLVHLYASFSSGNFTPLSCTVYAVGIFAFGASMLCAIPLISINRYVVVVLGKEEFFTDRRVICLCLSVYFLPVSYIVLTLTFPVGLISFLHCGYMYWFWYVRELMVVPITILYWTSMFCVVKLYFYIAKHIKSVSGYIEESRLKDERSLLLAITLQGLLPLLSCFPALLMICVGSLGKDAGIWMVMHQSFSIGPFQIIAPFINISISLISWSPVIDPLLTLFCVRQYRRVVVGWLQHFSHKMKISQWHKMKAVSNVVHPL